MTETSDTTQGKDEAAAGKAPLQIQVQVERLSEVERKLDVQVSWDDVKSRLDDAYKELQQGVTLKGFRRGKVPRKMLEQLFGKHVVKEVAQRMVQESVPQALREQGLNAVSEPSVSDEGIKEGEAFRYSATVQVVPEIEPRDYFGVEVKQRKARVSDDELESALRIKQREHTAYKAIEGRSTQAGDVVLVDLLGKLDGEPFSKENALVELGEVPQEPLPGLAARLTGIAPDTEELDLELEVPVHDHAPGEACPEGERKQRAHLLVTVKDTKQKIVPEIDDDFARDTGEAETLAELREVLRRRLLVEDEKRARDEARQRLIREITQRNNVPVVPALVEKQLDHAVRLQLALMGIDAEAEGIETDALKERVRGDASEAVRSAILLEAISKKEGVEVLEADVELKLAEIASQRSQNVARVRSDYEKEASRMAALRARIREDKVLDLLMSRATIIEETDEKPTDTGAGS
jgi:trigger factor